MERFSNDHEDRPSQHENSGKLSYEARYPVVNLIESQWKLKQQYDKTLGCHREVGLLTISRHSATRKHLFLYPQGDRSGLRNPKIDKDQH